VTARQLITAARAAGIQLDARDDRQCTGRRPVRSRPSCDALVRRKLDLLALLRRLDAMRLQGADRTGANTRPPVPVAPLDARGGPDVARPWTTPKRDVACELFYEERPSDSER
jgi:hypothetical protein